METIITISIGVVLILFFSALLRFRARALSGRLRLPPEAGGGWPVIGHLHLLGGSEPAPKRLAKMADTYGPIFTLKLGTHRALVVSNWEIARECFTTNDTTFSNRPNLLASELLGYDYAMFAFSPYAQYWRHVRKTVMLQLLSNRRLELLQHIRTSEVRSSVKKLYELWVNKGGGEEVVVEMKTWFGDITLNTIFRMVVGKRFSTVFDGSGNGQYYRTALRDFFELFGVFVLSDSFPFLKWLDLGGHQKAMKKTAKVLDQMLDKWLVEHRERNFGEVKMEEQDFMDVMLSSLKDGEFFGYDSNTVIKATCLALILGGGETIRAVMIWALSLLLNNEGALKKVQLELDEKVGRKRLVEELDVKNLLYLHAVVQETFRLYPPTPFLLPREAMEDCTVAGYHISVGTRLMVNLQKLQQDPFVWDDPSEFRPERFLTNRKDLDVRGQNFQLIPFGSGRRICPGASLSIQLIHLTLANLLHGFEIGRPSSKPIDMEESIGLTNIKKTPLEVVVLTPRLFAQAYE